MEKKTNDLHPLFHVAWENEHFKPLSTTEILANGILNQGFVNNANDEEIVTVEEVKRHMEFFHLRKGTPPPNSTKLMEDRNGKYVKSRKVKTARNK